MSNGLDQDQGRQNVGPDLVPTVCKGYEQTTKFAASKERVKPFMHSFLLLGHMQTTHA